MKNEQENGLHLLYKKLGETPNQCVLRFKKDNQEYDGIPMTYAGRLDPMAEGLLLVLSGEAIVEKEKYLAFPKTYVRQILWGFETDTLDILGLISKVSNTECLIKILDVEQVLKKSVGKFEQKYPVYSSKPVSGKPLFQWARGGRLSEVKIPKHEVEIFSAKFISRRTISGSDLVQCIVPKINLVNGDFRQKEIIEKWEQTLLARRSLGGGESKEMFTIDTIELKVSSGFYVRQFVSDLAENFGTDAITFHIKRNRIGDFSV